jgi:hypothetical protein
LNTPSSLGGRYHFYPKKGWHHCVAQVLAVSPYIRYILGMNSFIKGMGSFNLFPPVEKNRKPSVETAWEGVGKAFEAVGNDFEAAGRDMWKALEDAERIYNTPKQPVGPR